MYKTNLMPTLQEKSASGAVASFNTALAMPLVNGEFSIVAYQEGSGDPAPDNVRNIVPYNKLRINMVDFNQLVAIPSTDISKTENGVTFVDNRDGSITVSTDENGATADTIIEFTQLVQVYPQHKYLLLGGASGGSLSSYYWGLSSNTSITDKGSGWIYNRGSSGQNSFYPRIVIKSGTIISTPIIFKPQAIDLTQMFGSKVADYLYNLETQQAGSGVAIFKQLFYKDYYDYNVGGTWVSVASVNGDSYPDYAEVNLGEDVYGGSYNSATGEKPLTHLLIDLSTRVWRKHSTRGHFYFQFTEADNIKTPAGNTVPAEIVCNQYKTVAQNYLDNNCISLSSDRYLGIIDESLADLSAAEFQSAMNGVKLLYKLKDPIESNIGATPISTNIGNNTIFADTGDIDLTYKDLDIAKRGNFREVFRLPS